MANRHQTNREEPHETRRIIWDAKLLNLTATRSVKSKLTMSISVSLK
jgi:hypothetical protein